MESLIKTIEKQIQAMGPELRMMNSLAEVEQTLLPLLRDHFDASLVIFYLFGRGPLELLHLGGLPQLHDELLKFHGGVGARWLKKACMRGPILREHCGMSDDEFTASPLKSVLQDAGGAHSRGLVLNAKGEPLGIVALFRSARQPAFNGDHDSLLLTYAAPLSDLMERLINNRSLPDALPLETLNHLEEGITFFDDDLRLSFANEAGWSHLQRVSRRDGAWLALPSPLHRQLRLVRELDSGPEQWSQKHRFTPVLLKAENSTEIRFRTFAGAWPDRTRRFFYIISSMVRTLPAASIDQVAQRMGLTPREREVCAHLVEGKRNRDIANSFGITEHTVKIHVRRVLGKLRVRSRSEVPGAVLKALTRWENETEIVNNN